eukprot:jgi/Botrbrau1/10924/Bobra.0025s0097.1
MYSHDTNHNSKRPKGIAGMIINFCSLPGKTQWRDLPWELQKSVLASRALSLCDLAKMAPLGKVFKEAYLERCTADEQWLEHSAKSVFGASAVETLASWLPSPKWRHQSDGQKPVLSKLSEGEPWPDLSTAPRNRLNSVEQPARFVPTDPQLQNLTWIMIWANTLERGTVNLSDGLPYNQFFRIGFRGRRLRINFQPRSAANIAPCLGLAYLACKKSAESLGRWKNKSASDRLGSVCVRGPQGTFTWPWSDVQGVPPDAQRAFSLMHMQTRTSWRGIFELSLEWNWRHWET